MAVDLAAETFVAALGRVRRLGSARLSYDDEELARVDRLGVRPVAELVARQRVSRGLATLRNVLEER